MRCLIFNIYRSTGADAAAARMSCHSVSGQMTPCLLHRIKLYSSLSPPPANHYFYGEYLDPQPCFWIERLNVGIIGVFCLSGRVSRAFVAGGYFKLRRVLNFSELQLSTHIPNHFPRRPLREQLGSSLIIGICNKFHIIQMLACAQALTIHLGSTLVTVFQFP